MLWGRTLCVHTCACVHTRPRRLDECLDYLKEAGGVKNVKNTNGKIGRGGREVAGDTQEVMEEGITKNFPGLQT